jgi:NADH-quinone oxidoreductase subunit J
MSAVFYIAAAVAVISTVMVITRLNAIHALLYLIVSLLAVAVIFFTLGAAFAAALEVIIYAGAIMVLFVFVVMLLNLGPQSTAQESRWLSRRSWIGPAILALILIGEQAFIIARGASRAPAAGPVGPKQVGIALYGPYLLGVELASLLLLAGIIGARRLGLEWGTEIEREGEKEKGRQGDRETRRQRIRRSFPCLLVSLSPLLPVSVSPLLLAMAPIPMEHGLLLAGTLFALGMIGVMVRRDIVFILMSLEIMLNATGLAFVTAGARWAQADGQVMYFFILSMAAAEVAVGLALTLKLRHEFRTLDADAASRMHG